MLRKYRYGCQSPMTCFPLELWRTLFNGRPAFGESPKAGRQNPNQRTLGRDIGRVACAHVQGFDLKAHALGR